MTRALKHSKTTALQINWWLKKRDVWTKNHLTKKRRKGYNGLWNQEVKLFKAGSTVTLLSASKQDLTSLKKQLWYIAELPLIVALHDWLQKQTMNEVKANQGDLASWGEMRPWCEPVRAKGRQANFLQADIISDQAGNGLRESDALRRSSLKRKNWSLSESNPFKFPENHFLIGTFVLEFFSSFFFFLK